MGGEPIPEQSEVDPYGQEGSVGDCEESVDRRHRGLADGQVVSGVVGAGVVRLRVDRHRDRGTGVAIGEVEAVFVGTGDGEGFIVSAAGRRWGKLQKVEEELDVRVH